MSSPPCGLAPSVAPPTNECSSVVCASAIAHGMKTPTPTIAVEKPKNSNFEHLVRRLITLSERRVDEQSATGQLSKRSKCWSLSILQERSSLKIRLELM